VLDVTTVVLELAQELERQGALALGSPGAGALEGVPQQGLRVLETPLQPGDVPGRDPRRRDAQLVGDLDVDLLGAPVALERLLPVAAVLAHDAEVEERIPRLGETPALTEDLEGGAQVGLRLVPFAQVPVDEPDVVADVGRGELVAGAAVERQSLLVEVAGARQVALAIGHAAEQVERLRREREIAALVGEAEAALGMLAALREAGEPEQRLRALEVEPGAQRGPGGPLVGFEPAFEREQLTAVSERPLGVTL